MVELLLYLVLVIAVLAGGLVLIASRRPDTFEVVRSTTIDAPPSAVFPLIDDLKAMGDWIPFLDPDPNAEVGFRGPQQGVGAVRWWRGNRQVGEGNIEIVESAPPSKIAMKLNMLRPMKASNDVSFRLTPAAGGTSVTWAISGRQPLMSKIMSLFMDFDGMLGSQFETGLARLKDLAEGR